jgi:hypothetical protein
MATPVSCKIDYETRKQLLEDIKLLSKEEYHEIFRIIKRNNVDYTENSNGVFFDLSGLADEIILELQKFLEYCKEQRNSEKVRTQELESLRNETTAA